MARHPGHAVTSGRATGLERSPASLDHDRAVQFGPFRSRRGLFRLEAATRRFPVSEIGHRIIADASQGKTSHARSLANWKRPSDAADRLFPRANRQNSVTRILSVRRETISRAAMERAAMRHHLQSFPPVARSRPPRGASPVVAKAWLSRACRTAFFCLVQFGPLIAGSEAIAADRLDTKPLVDMANRYQVPTPPKEARVVFASTGWWARVADDLSLHVYSPAFLLEERRDGSLVILRGLKREVLPKRESTDPPSIKPFSAKKIEPRAAGFIANFHDRPALVFAIQLAARGDEATAQDVWRQVATTTEWTSDLLAQVGLHLKSKVGHPNEEIRKPALILAECIFDDLESRLTQKDAHWQTIYDRMQALIEEVPELSKGNRKVLFGDLAKTLAASPPPPGSIAAKLLAWSRQPHDDRTYNPFEQGCNPAPPQRDAPAREIVLQGFDAIPPLLELLRDNRLTAHRESPDLGDGILRVRHLASILLSGMTGAPDCLHGCDNGEPRCGCPARMVGAGPCSEGSRRLQRDNLRATKWVHHIRPTLSRQDSGCEVSIDPPGPLKTFPQRDKRSLSLGNRARVGRVSASQRDPDSRAVRRGKAGVSREPTLPASNPGETRRTRLPSWCSLSRKSSRPIRTDPIRPVRSLISDTS